jgi:modulator of FtsH protease
MGLTLGPILNNYLSALDNGYEIIATALGGTGVMFLGLSGYVLTSRKDFSFIGGFLTIGVLVAFLAGIGAIVFSIPALSLAVSAMFILLMSGLILYQTSEIIHGGETNYILATITLYIAIYNMFLSLLHILGVVGGYDYWLRLLFLRPKKPSHFDWAFLFALSYFRVSKRNRS